MSPLPSTCKMFGPLAGLLFVVGRTLSTLVSHTSQREAFVHLALKGSQNGKPIFHLGFKGNQQGIVTLVSRETNRELSLWEGGKPKEKPISLGLQNPWVPKNPIDFSAARAAPSQPRSPTMPRQALEASPRPPKTSKSPL